MTSSRKSAAGPAPLPSAPAHGQARLAVATAVDQAGPEGLGVAPLARMLNLHQNSVRHHLTALEAESLVVSTPDPGGGPGRPALVYRTTPAGIRTLAGPGAASHPDLTAALVSVAEQHPGLLHEAGLRWGHRLATPAPAPKSDPVSAREGLARIMTEQGFIAAADDEQIGTRDALELTTCPLLEEARRNPEAVCGLHASMVEGIVETWGIRHEVSLEPFALPNGCRLTVTAL